MKNKRFTVTPSFIDSFSSDIKPLSLEEYKNTVIRDIYYLLSSTSHFDNSTLKNLGDARRSVLNYGIKSVAGSDKKLIKSKLIDDIREKLIYFEPRLLSDSIIVTETSQYTSNTLELRIIGTLCTPNTEEAIELKLSVDTEGHIGLIQ
jgi:predicted component of type VI protein secretion system